MASNVVADVRKLCVSAAKKGHAQFGVVQTPAKWASLAGYSGSAASPLRKFMARDSDNGVGRSGRYGAQSAADMLELLDRAEQFATADSETKAEAARRKVRQQLDKNRQAAKSGAKQVKGAAVKPRAVRKSKKEAAPAQS